MNRWKIFMCSLLVLACCAVLVPSASAQFRASLQGTVTDSQGAVVPGVTVTLTSNETNITRQTTSNDSGFYAFTNLAPGRYSLVAERTGFKKATLQNVQVEAERSQGADIQLAIGEVAEEVTVSADALPNLQTETAQIGGTVNQREVQNLPALGRDPFQLLRLAPGVFGVESLGGNLPGNAGPGGTSVRESIFQTENKPQISANGGRVESNNYQVDGVSTNSIAWNGASVITPNNESVKEVQIVSNSYSAEYGRNNGAQVLVVSQNGTNSLHGSALLKVHRPGLNAYRNWSRNQDNGAAKPEDRGLQRDNERFNQWAGSLGGPIIKDRLFGFFSYETLRLGTVGSSNNWYESPEFLTSAPAGSIAERILSYPGEGVSLGGIVQVDCAFAGLDPGVCQQTPNGLDIGSPIAAPLGTRSPSTVGGGLDGIPDVVYANAVSPFDRIAQQFNGRVDFQATTKDMLTFSTYWTPVKTESFNGPVRPANAWTQDRLNWSAAAVWTRTFTPTLLNEARVNFTRWSWDEIASNPQEPWGLPQSNIRNMGNVGVQFFGAPGPSVFAENTLNIRDTVSKVIGTHNLRFGADIYREQRLDTAPWSARPVYDFFNIWDFLNDAPFQESANFDSRTGQPSESRKYIRSGMYAGFLQDDWKARPNLTLNFGLRWEYFGPVNEKNDNLSNVLLGSGADVLTGLRLKTGGGLYEASKNNWGPQVGFAWNPTSLFGLGEGRAVIRGGFGIGYNRQMEASILDVRNNPPGGTVSYTFLADEGTLVYAVPDDPNQFTNWPVNPNAIVNFDPTTGLPIGPPINLVAVQNDLPTTRTYRYSLDAQYDFGGNWVGTLGYQGSTTNNYTIRQQLNAIYAPLNPQVRSLQMFSNIADASFNALIGEIRHRFSRTFEADLQYRWSHTIDHGSNDYYYPTYQWNTDLEKASADFDVRHNVKLWGLWQPTFFGGRSALDKILGGWTLSGILNWHSGFPWTPLYEVTGGCHVVFQSSPLDPCVLRPASYAGGAGNDFTNEVFQTIGGQFPTTSQFPSGSLSYFAPPSLATVPVFPATGTIPPAPGIGRNSFRGPHFLNVDMTFAKAFGLPRMPVLGESAQLEFRASAYNVFNKVNLKPFGFNSSSTRVGTISVDQVTGANTVSGNSEFGRAEEALSGRVVELQARFSF